MSCGSYCGRKKAILLLLGDIDALVEGIVESQPSAFGGRV
jgi:hypothetical protein